MVKVREEHPVFKDGSVNLEQWMQRLQKYDCIFDAAVLQRACKIARIAEQEAQDNV